LGDYYYLCGIISYYEKFTLSGEVKCIDDEIPFEIPNGWEWCRLGDITSITGGKRVPVGYSLTNQNTGYKYIRVADMKQYSVRNNDVHYISKEIYSLIKNYTISKDDLYITVAGTIGVVGEIPIEFDGANLTENANKIVFTQLNKKCLMYLLSSDYVQTQIKNCTTKVGQPKLAIIRIQNFLLPIPPLKEQQRIVEKIEELIPHIEHYSKAQAELDLLNRNIKEQLKKSVLQYAIEGKLVPQDEAEGTAEELLLQIQAEKQKLYEENKLKKKDLEHSIIFKAEDNKYYEKIGKNVTEIESDYSFPNSWAITRLSSICILTDGEKKEGQNICLDAKFLRGKTEGDYLQKGRFVEKGDNIILVDGENSGEVFTIPRNGYMGSTFKKLWVNPVMDLQYVLYFIQFYKDLLRNSKKGAAIPHLNKELFYSLLIGIPPLSEQQRIVNTIQNIFRCIEKN